MEGTPRSVVVDTYKSANARHLRRHRTRRLCQVAHLVEVDADRVRFAFSSGKGVRPVRASRQHQFVADVDGMLLRWASVR